MTKTDHREEAIMDMPHRRRRGPLIGMSALYLLLAIAPSATAVPALPDGYQPPTQTQPAPPPGASAPEPVVDLASSGVNWETAALVALAVLVVSALVVIARRRWPVTAR